MTFRPPSISQTDCPAFLIVGGKEACTSPALQCRAEFPAQVCRITHYLKDNFEAICAVIRVGQDQGFVRPGNPAQLYYACIGIAGTLATLAPEYEELSGESAPSPEAIASTCALIDALLFIKLP